jgi:FkbM family methyltransferase
MNQMLLRPLLDLVGWPRPPTQVWGHELTSLELSGEGPITLARWLHPAAQRAPARIDQAEVDALRTFLRPGDVAIDVGAGAGTHAVACALALGPTGTVIAFEPNQAVFPVLAANAAHSRARGTIHPHLFAVATEDGPLRLDFADPGFRRGGSRPEGATWAPGRDWPRDVEGVALEPFLAARHPGAAERLRYLRLHLGGDLLPLLESLRPLLARTRPWLRLSVSRNVRKARRLALLAFLAELDYAVERAASADDRKGGPVTPATVMRWRHLDLLCAPGAPGQGA